jgi:hypothetical protein
MVLACKPIIHIFSFHFCVTLQRLIIGFYVVKQYPNNRKYNRFCSVGLGLCHTHYTLCCLEWFGHQKVSNNKKKIKIALKNTNNPNLASFEL